MGAPIVSPLVPTGSTNGRMVKVVATGTPGTALHTAVAGTTDWDEIEVHAVNSDTTDRKLTVEWGGVTAPDDLIEVTIPAESGLILVVPMSRLNNGLAVRAFAATANVILCLVRVNRVTA